MTSSPLFKSALCLCVFSASSTVGAADVIHVNRPFVQVSDVLQIEGSLNQDTMSRMIEKVLSLPLVKLEAGVERTVSAGELERLLVRRVPGLAGRLSVLNKESLVFKFENRNVRENKSCYLLNEKMETGASIVRPQVSFSDSCLIQDYEGLYYDPQIGTYVATQNLEAGHQIPIQTLNVLPFVSQGESVVLTTQVGPVNISRPVTLTEPIFSSGVTHVRTSDGVIVKAHFPVDQEVKP